MTTKRLLITGATGFVGRHLVARLDRERSQLTLAVRDAAACASAWRDNVHIRIVETGDIETASNLDGAFADAGCVVHLAGLANVAGDTDDRLEKANVAATRALAEAAAKHGVEKFIHLSSLFAIAGNSASKVIDDDTAAAPASAYGKSKRQAEDCVKPLAGNGMLCVSLRPPLVIGPDAKGNWAALQKLAATGLPLPLASVRNRRSLISVDSLVDVIAHLCGGAWPPAASGAYCVADAGPLSTADMIAELRRGMGRPPRLVPVPPALLRTAAALMNQRRRAASLLDDCEVDDARFRRTFGYRQTTDLKEFIRRCGAHASRQD